MDVLTVCFLAAAALVVVAAVVHIGCRWCRVLCRAEADAEPCWPFLAGCLAVENVLFVAAGVHSGELWGFFSRIADGIDWMARPLCEFFGC
ncbi:hypothetical protein BLEM_1109 [Bifidobacterium lemurum]|uniref:Uncharacterized protein n=1 Tax=Bifidobacterium lemurum TaxID=1603886 RepID=A0A261FUE4_9BIFI|nr:hypothetical protein [Bifidobacterium lemurum]OZG62563.1 hypothetical protein BLEM_1109 [Bifidobacterium lemurum]QOL33895.1 hypothetical protein BL8807_09015 [Bifidobacterium lemurum]